MFEKNEMLLRFGNNYQINVLKNEIEKIKVIYEEKVQGVEQRSFKL